MTINSITYINEVIFDYTEKIKNKQSSFRFLLDFLKVCASIGYCLRELLSKQQLQLKMVNKEEEQFELQPLTDYHTYR